MASFLDVCRFIPTLGGTTDWTYSSAVTGYQGPTAAGAVNGALYRYRAESADLTQWEIGTGTYNSGTGVFARTTVFFNSLGTTAKVNFSTVPQVAIVAIAEDFGSSTPGNVSLGNNSGNSLSTSTLNVMIGPNAGKAMTSGTGENTLVGSTAGQAITTGTQNTIVGAEAGSSITGDTGHTLVGWTAGAALNSNTTTWNTFVGHASGFLAAGAGGCVAVGRAAGRGFLNDTDCVAVGHASFFYNNGGACTSVSAFGNQAAAAPVDGTGTNWQGSGLTYWGAINDTNVLYVGVYSGKSSAAARTNSAAIGALARLPLKDNTIVLGNNAVTTVETTGNYYDGWSRVDITSTAGINPVTAAQLLSGLVVRSGALTGAVNDTTDTAANLVINGPGQNAQLPCSIERSYGNNTSGGFSITMVGGTGVAFSGLGLGGVVASNVLAKFRFVYTNTTPGSEAVTVYRVG